MPLPLRSLARKRRAGPSRPIRWVTAIALTLACIPAQAHRGSEKLIVVERTEAGASLTVEVELVDAAVEIGLDEDAPRDAVMARADAVSEWLRGGIVIDSRSGPCEVTAGRPEPLERDGEARLLTRLDARCPAPVEGVTLRDDTVFEDDPQHEAFVRIRWSGETDAHVLRQGRQELALGAPPSIAGLLGRFLVEGVRHLVGGYDHLLFLLSLVLTAGGLARDEGLKKALRDVAWIVTAFTLGHSVTLIAAALGVVVLPSRLVESAIAASILVVAGLNVARPQPEHRRAMPWLALGFGLIHGFGFSGVLADLGLPAQARVLSLVAFNVGIELAQLAFVAVVMLPLARLARLEGYERWIVRGGSLVIAGLALVWLVERAAG